MNEDELIGAPETDPERVLGLSWKRSSYPMNKQELLINLRAAFANTGESIQIDFNNPEHEKEYLNGFFSLKNEVKEWLLPHYMIRVIDIADRTTRKIYFSRLIEFLDVDFDDFSNSNVSLKVIQKEAVAGYGPIQAQAIRQWLEYLFINYPDELEADGVRSAIRYWRLREAGS